MNRFQLKPKYSVTSTFYNDNVSATVNYTINIDGLPSYNPLKHYTGVPESGFKIFLGISSNARPLPRIIGTKLNELLLQGKLWKESQIQIVAQPIQEGHRPEELKKKCVLNYNCKVTPSEIAETVKYLPILYECLGHDEDLREGLWQTIQIFGGGGDKSTCYKPVDIDGLVIAPVAITNKVSMESRAAQVSKDKLSHAIRIDGNDKSKVCDTIIVSTQKSLQHVKPEAFEELSVASVRDILATEIPDEEVFQMLV